MSTPTQHSRRYSAPLTRFRIKTARCCLRKREVIIWTMRLAFLSTAYLFSQTWTSWWLTGRTRAPTLTHGTRIARRTPTGKLGTHQCEEWTRASALSARQVNTIFALPPNASLAAPSHRLSTLRACLATTATTQARRFRPLTSELRILRCLWLVSRRMGMSSTDLKRLTQQELKSKSHHVTSTSATGDWRRQDQTRSTLTAPQPSTHTYQLASDRVISMGLPHEARPARQMTSSATGH
mmetsp:Transcript_39567/g.51837  ORF Transcript_39567/g.51837 Transcript_39567/m.51837 type:complete len:238 (+) Transcript_39567:401-1114(+)